MLCVCVCVYIYVYVHINILNVSLGVEAQGNGTLRLVGGSNYRSGRVEIFIVPNNTWGTICNTGWDSLDAKVVCKQLGFGSTGTSLQTFSPNASPSVPIWLNNVNCNGFESRLIDCRHSGLGNHSCDHHQHAGVACAGSLPGIMTKCSDTKWRHMNCKHVHKHVPKIIIIFTLIV